MRYHQRNTLRGVFYGIDFARRIILNLLFWGLIVFVIILLVPPRAQRVKDGSILVLNPYGILVDAYTIPTSYQGIPVGGYLDETLLDDLITSLDAAKSDERISGVWLRLDDMVHAGPSAAGELTDSILQFRKSGKAVVASADTFDTSRYRIASAADTVIVDRLGEVFPTGYGYWRAYYGEGFDRLGAKANLFRSGESKTGAENYVLGAMSEAARRDEERLLGDLWTTWIDSVAVNRGIEPEKL
ncbi:MAG: S49 family peptidase, partial [Spirochaetaceae bacterium]|nr:S49 family peptidase [Spirochaetaceae bacterium]